MLASYITALEMRAKWLRWIKEEKSIHPTSTRYVREVLPMYVSTLENGDSLFMDRHFCDMVNHARMTVPDDMRFENAWMQTKSGFMWLEDSFETPEPTGLQDELKFVNKGLLRAVGWHYVPYEETYQFVTYMDFADYVRGGLGFGAWSYFAIHEGDTVLSKTHEFEERARQNSVIAKALNEDDQLDTHAGYYDKGKETDMRHEIRWVYTAMYLMAQRLAHVADHKPSSMARSMAARKKLQLAPFLKVVSLRRMQEERPKDAAQARDWQWQWAVRGHWRMQPYPSEGVTRQIFIESYMKGPEDKPVKPPTHTMFVARK